MLFTSAVSSIRRSFVRTNSLDWFWITKVSSSEVEILDRFCVLFMSAVSSG
jgi:hypothetical protein